MSGDTNLANLVGAGANFRASGIDSKAQEDARRIAFTGPAAMRLLFEERDFPSQAAVKIRYQVHARPAAPVLLTALASDAAAGIDLTPTFALAQGKGWREAEVPLACLATGDIAGLNLASADAFVFDLETIRVVPQATQMDCTGPF